MTAWNAFLVAAGTWLASDAIYSWVLYRQTQSWRGDKQTFLKDHWLRLARLLLAAGIVAAGVSI